MKKKTLNPVWNEVLGFEGFTRDKLMKRSVLFTVFDHDRIGRDEEIGELKLVLVPEHLQHEAVPFVKKLLPCKVERFNNSTRFFISNSFISITGLKMAYSETKISENIEN